MARHADHERFEWTVVVLDDRGSLTGAVEAAARMSSRWKSRRDCVPVYGEILPGYFDRNASISCTRMMMGPWFTGCPQRGGQAFGAGCTPIIMGGCHR